MIVHAAGETGPAAEDTIAVLLQVADERALLDVLDLVPEAHLVREPDAPYNGAAMSLGLRPGGRRPELRKLRLWNPMPD